MGFGRVVGLWLGEGRLWGGERGGRRWLIGGGGWREGGIGR
jgi:hypothetical protein